MPKNTNLSPETTQEIIALANDMTNVFSPPELIPGCEVLSITDKDQYATDNGWIEAICGKHNNQRCRWKAKFSNVQVGDYVDVLYFKSVSIFEVFGKGGGGSVSGLPLTTKGDLLGYSTLPTRYPASGNDGYVLTEDSGETFGFSWQAAGGGGGWPYTNVLTVDPSDADADYTTITLAIAGATAGDAIWIGNATYSENITVNKKLYLIGASREGVIIDGTFTTTTADCVIENLTIFRDDAGSSDVNIFTAGADATLRRVTLSGLTVTTTGALNGIYNVNTYEITAEDCTIELADTSSSATHGVYVDAASAVVNVVGGIVDAQSSGGSAYDVRINEDGTINLRDPELVNNTLDDGSGTINGQYTTDGVLYSLDDVIQSYGNDIYPDGDGAGVQQRLNIWTTPLYHFNDSTELSANFTWDAVNFAGTPSTINTSLFESIAMIYNTTANDFFAYRTLVSTSTVETYARLTIGSLSTTAYAYGGIRIDNPSSPTTNFFELRIVPNTTGDSLRLMFRYNNGGGVTTSYYAPAIPAGFYTIGLIYIDSSNVGTAYYTLSSPRPSFIANAYPTWSSATVRAGVITGLIGGFAGSIDRGAYFDYWSE